MEFTNTKNAGAKVLCTFRQLKLKNYSEIFRSAQQARCLTSANVKEFYCQTAKRMAIWKLRNRALIASVTENVNAGDIMVYEIRHSQVAKNKQVSEKEIHILNKNVCH